MPHPRGHGPPHIRRAWGEPGALGIQATLQDAPGARAPRAPEDGDGPGLLSARGATPPAVSTTNAPPAFLPPGRPCWPPLLLLPSLPGAPGDRQCPAAGGGAPPSGHLCCPPQEEGTRDAAEQRRKLGAQGACEQSPGGHAVSRSFLGGSERKGTLWPPQASVEGQRGSSRATRSTSADERRRAQLQLQPWPWSHWLCEPSKQINLSEPIS